MESQPQSPEFRNTPEVSLKILNSGLILKMFTHDKMMHV